MKTNAWDEKWSDWIKWGSIDKPATLHSDTQIQAINDDGDTLGDGTWHFTARDCEWSEITAYRYKIKEPESDMHPDLEWLARNVDQWIGSFEWLGIQASKPLWAYTKTSFCKYDKPQWQAARQQLGLDQPEVTPEEEEAWQAKERSLYGEIKEGFDSMTDNVNKPKHYQLRDGYEVYDLRQDLAAKAANGGATYDQYSDWDRAIEYIIRMWGKNRLEDAKKGRWYLDKLIGKLEAQGD